MSAWRNTISVFHGATQAVPTQTLTVEEVLTAIQTGVYRQPIEQIRQLRRAQGEAAYKAAKNRLDAVTFCGTFAPTRAKAHLVHHSGLVHGDLDHLGDVQAVKQRLCADPQVAYCFISPSGDGLKLGVPVAPVADDTTYKHAWQTIADYFQQQYGITWDPSGKDISRLCFVSWDPELYANAAAQVFCTPDRPAVPLAPSHRASGLFVVPKSQAERYAQQALTTAVAMIDASQPGGRHHARARAAYLLGGLVAGGVMTPEDAWKALEAAVARNTTSFMPAMQTVRDCFEAGMKHPITPEALTRERRQWRGNHWRQLARPHAGTFRTRDVAEVPVWQK